MTDSVSLRAAAPAEVQLEAGYVGWMGTDKHWNGLSFNMSQANGAKCLDTGPYVWASQRSGRTFSMMGWMEMRHWEPGVAFYFHPNNSYHQTSSSHAFLKSLKEYHFHQQQSLT